MTEFCIQLQPERAPEVDFEAIKQWAGSFADSSSFVTDFWIDAGDDYINLRFSTDMPKLFWHAFAAEFLDCNTEGQLNRSCCIAYCQGRRGWDDYLLLHHFDPTEPLDRLI